MNPNISLPQLPANLDPALRDYLFAWQKLITSKQLDDYAQAQKEAKALIDNGGGIIESVNNTNGRGIKFKDGTMICWSTKSWTGTCTNGVATDVSASINWDFPFVFFGDIPVIQFTRLSGWAYLFNSGYEYLNNNFVRNWYIYNMSQTRTINHTFRLLAIGRWK